MSTREPQLYKGNIFKAPLPFHPVLETCSDFFARHAKLIECPAEFYSELQMRDSTTLRIAFVGEFNSGKSSLINLICSQPILPTGRFPETGVVCRIAGGPAHVVNARSGDCWRRIGERADDIRAVISLTKNGRRVDTTNIPDEILITSPKLPTPPGVFLVDTPGFNDSPEMTARAVSAAADADLVVWIFSSRQFLSTVERAVLEELVARRGRAGLHFIVNIFLEGEDAASLDRDWRARHAEDLPAQIEKLETVKHGLGLSALPLLSISAKAATEIDAKQYGAVALREQILRTVECEGRILINSRRFAATRSALGLLRAQLEQAARTEKEKYDTAQRRWLAFERQRERVDGFERTLKQLVGHAVEQYVNDTASIGDEVAARVTVSDLARDSTYENALKAAFAGAAQRAAKRLAKDIENARLRYEVELQQAAKHRDIEARLAAKLPSIEIPNNSVLGAVAVGAAGGAGVGTIVPVVGTLAGGIIGAVAGLVGGANQAMMLNVSQTQANIKTAARTARDAVRSQISQTTDAITGLYKARKPPQPRRPSPKAYNSVQRDIDEAARLMAALDGGCRH